MNNVDADKSRILREILSSETEGEKIVYSMFTVRDVNLIPYDMFSLISTLMGAFLNGASKSELGVIGLVMAQMLSISGCLKGIDAITEEAILNFKLVEEVPDKWEVKILDDYLFNKKSDKAKEKFIASIGKLTDRQDILCAASNFVFYHTKVILNEDEIIQRDMGLLNLIKLSIRADIISQVRKLLLSDFKIDMAQFISNNIETFIS